MEDRYQYARTDGHLDWTPGYKSYDNFWAPVRDILRFHRGDKFRIVERPSGDEGPLQTLGELEDKAHNRLDNDPPDTLFDLQSEKDKFSLAVRRHPVETGGDRVIAHAAARVGTPYRFGVTDCSWLSETCYFPETGDDWPHNAHDQHEMFKTRAGYDIISKSQIKPGDLLWFHNDDHVAIFLDWVDGGRVWDTEPHGVQGPTGWGYIFPGVRIRPMSGNYYCAWQYVCGIGRVVEVNGQP